MSCRGRSRKSKMTRRGTMNNSRRRVTTSRTRLRLLMRTRRRNPKPFGGWKLRSSEQIVNASNSTPRSHKRNGN